MTPVLPQLYYHGEPISVNVHVTNNSSKSVKKVKVSGEVGAGGGGSFCP